MYDILIAPFVDYLFMQRALVATLAIALSCGSLGIFLVLRRMSLMGDALSHAMLPGIAAGYLISGLSLAAMSLGGIIAGLIVAVFSGYIARNTVLAEDASFTGLYIISLALGVMLLSLKGGNLNLTHFLFGSVLAVDKATMLYVAGAATLSLIILAITYRPLIYECFDPTFIQLMGVRKGIYHSIFLVLIVINLVGACQALGTMMALGIMMLPAITARLVAKQVWSAIAISVTVGIGCGYLGLVLSYHNNWPSGPTIILLCGIVYFSTLLFKGFKKLLRDPDAQVMAN